MKKLFLVPFAAAALAGCWFMGQPKAVVLVTDQARAKSLMTALQLQNTGLQESEIAVRLVKKNDPGELLEGLKWAAGKGVKAIGLDKDAYAPGDLQIEAILKVLKDDGIYVAGVEFAG
ncbi:MAG: hypothetical protein A2X31_12290 [Elusimicrobia bacterium GWB2_63_22]|nr:MAG: hypothetical protein A2X31_12290 [Elusimicrobia bacterium GWB2_63_22]